jgi:hypothetical protein
MRRAVFVPLVLSLFSCASLPIISLRAQAACVSYGDYLHLLGSCNPGGYPRGMEYRAPYLYLAEYDRVFRVVDASDPTRMNLIGSLPLPAIPADLDVAGALGCVVLDSRVLQLVDLSNPEAPEPLGSVSIPSGPRSVAIAGSYAFVTATQYPGEEGLYVFDLADPAAPTLVMRVDVGDSPRNAEIDGAHAYVLTFDRLSILDISDPTAPVLSGSLLIPGQPMYLTCRGDFVYVVCRASDEERSWGDGLYVIDRSDLSNPRIVGTYAPEEEAPFLGIGLWRNYAIVARYGAIVFMDVVDPTAPRPALEIGVQPYASEFAVVGSVLFAWGDRLMSYLLQEPFSPDPVAVIDGTAGCGEVVARGSRAFTAQTWGRNFFSIDLSVPEHPTVTTLPLPFEDAYTLAATEAGSGTPCVYVGGNGSPDSTAIVDVSDPRNPRIVNFMILPHGPSDLEVEGTRLYTIEGAVGVRIYDIADPVHPHLVCTIPFTFTPQMLHAVGDRLYVGRRISDLEHLFIYDVAKAEHPVLLGTSPLPELPYAIETEGNLAYAAGGTYGLLVLDVSDPASVRLISRVQAIGDAHDLRRDGSLLYVTDMHRYAGVHVIDVSDPYNPAVVGRFQVDAAYNVELISGHAFVTSNWTSAVIAPLDCSSSDVEPPAVGRARRLLSVSSNPMRGSLGVTVTMPEAGPALLSVFDPAGRLVRILHDGRLERGVRSFPWDGRDGRGRPAAAGVYFMRLKSGAAVAGCSVVRLP